MTGLQILSSPADIQGFKPSMGSVLVGTIIGAFLSGIVTMQVFLYYRIYPRDRMAFKLSVALIWVVDLLHTSMASAANWEYLIENFGNDSIADHITWTIAVTIALTAVITFFVHMFFAHRIFSLSRHNYLITLPIALLALARLALALVSTSKMIQLRSYHDFVQYWAFIFTAGLSSATAVDIMIAGALIYYLHRSRTGFSSMDAIIDSITLYTVENGLLTSVTTLVSLICWVSMPHNLIFLGLHFAISKLYANAFLATLNARKVLRGRSQGSSDRSDHPMPVLFSENLSRMSRNGRFTSRHDIEPITTKVQINVEKTIEYDGEEVEANPSSEISYPPSSPSKDRAETRKVSMAV
ncbi:hypothetical protein EIP91_001288 [Steccherinum ochraceum]|uniref:DUF6534 domain-containing protein n=1 Tax=Steccherinum ochraceum TaxID=92696 RepID=A0A4R0RH97_9APHY|nr:hypothetical protein EIP91_001288 [Steccherinum ochraceum]